jgi:hypothetical protein
MDIRAEHRDRRAPISALALMLLSFILSACADSSLAAGDADQDTNVVDSSQNDGPPPEWENLLIDGDVVGTIPDASAALRFAPTLPIGIGAPDRIVLGGSDGGGKSTILATRFNTEKHGMFWLIQEESQIDQKELEGLAASCDPAKGCVGSWTVVSLDAGTRALAIVGPEVTSVMWLHGAIRFDLTGPSATFDVAKAREIAGTMNG